MTPSRLKLVPQTEPGPTERVRQRLRKTARPATMLICPRCTGQELIETKVGVLFKGGRPSGGTKQLLCAGCLMKGERVVIA